MLSNNIAKMVFIGFLVSSSLYPKNIILSRIATQKGMPKSFIDKIIESEKILAKQMLICRELAKKNVLNMRSNDINISRQEDRDTLFYIYSENKNKCTLPYVKSYYFSIVRLIAFKKYNKINYDDDLKYLLAIADMRENSQYVRSKKVSPKTLQRLKRLIGDKPFNLQSVFVLSHRPNRKPL